VGAKAETRQEQQHGAIALELKQLVLDKVTPLNGTPGRYRPDNKLLAFSEACDNTDYVPRVS
jgi:hypothetical protein